jgi:hypothetical protein
MEAARKIQLEILRARSLAPLVKARGLGMTPFSNRKRSATHTHSLPECFRVNAPPAPYREGGLSASISFWSGIIPGTSHFVHISSILLWK